MMRNDDFHDPVLPGPILDLLNEVSGPIVDCTVGGGGHAEALLSSGDPGRFLIGLDRDEETLAVAERRLAPFAGRYRLHHLRFSQLPVAIEANGLGEVHAIMADLGVNSHQLTTGDRGFSLKADGPLDMRMDASLGVTALDLIDRSSVDEMTRILREYGEVRGAHKLARAMKQDRRAGRLATTRDLAGLCERVLHRRGRIHPATQTFMALRIAVNDELGELDRLLEFAPQVLAPGGILAIISFHSLEDRRVKHAFRDGRRAGTWDVLTPKPIIPDREEERSNPRSRSAKLRAAKREPMMLELGDAE